MLTNITISSNLILVLLQIRIVFIAFMFFHECDKTIWAISLSWWETRRQDTLNTQIQITYAGTSFCGAIPFIRSMDLKLVIWLTHPKPPTHHHHHHHHLRHQTQGWNPLFKMTGSVSGCHNWCSINVSITNLNKIVLHVCSSPHLHIMGFQL